ncbi:MAG: hypothetical protein QM831_12005 [Kofleriaceae bacterium]
MSELGTLGIQVKRSHQTNSTNINGMELSSKESTQLTLTLPKPAKVKATFSTESVGKKLVKIFKKELQTGDPHFDDEIYISTDTPDETKAFLDDDVRSAVGVLVTTGGPIHIEGTQVTITLAGKIEDGEDPHEVLVIAKAVLA